MSEGWPTRVIVRICFFSSPILVGLVRGNVGDGSQRNEFVA